MLDNPVPKFQQFENGPDDVANQCLYHDMAEILMVIQGCCELMEDVTSDQQRPKLIATMLSACRRAASLLTPRRIRSNALETDPATSHLPQILDEVSQMVGAANPNVKISVTANHANLSINMPSPVLFRCLMNIVANAAEAVRSDDNQSGRREIEIHVVVNDAMANIAIRNTGPEIDPEVIDQIFNPDYSTRKTQRGEQRGLGLYIVRTLLHQFGGTVGVHSSNGYRTTFQVRVPICSQ